MLPFKKILCPTDFSGPAAEALQRARELALHFKAKLLILHVAPPVPVPYQPITAPAPAPELTPVFNTPSYQLEIINSAEKALKELIDQQIPPNIEVQALVATGDPASEIVKLADQENVDVIVIATHGQTGWRRVVFGSVAEKVVRLAKPPVLTIRAPEETD
ncbi:MAG: universal stress protein [Deltaproteobacteria bacterium]|nr:universal stress protein [Deltaproteobacteria bacterium]